MKVNFINSLKNLSLDINNPESFDELLSELYWYADAQLQRAKEQQQTEVIMQWEHRVQALDMACQALDAINEDDSYYLVY
ncbi:hypothetical protein HC931_10215 [Candidatus Gracilibacteria bacterium]|jgi:flagellin-specific chaperone FliS|nr:hypothetical protein [Candidatus Gracilibacteria bacterium]NJM90330.1 hypothetical protein [Hydrococcus sp. RU_2_2]NJP20516.1 hypothetical protein [Hydrococcus sp. CRU_1_1]NJQ97326.1 hypothetical protein [Hydrococcus sp. CSU_1_8]